ncbi:uncharacterized protein LOC117587724 [Drosophila guanche]|uniref:Blast:Sterile alpha motif domain-containing protein 15 n=1 Tax=Drosophila guanche TaxID=7266 RepID=A0A3B0JYF1_DROGU|nr:uncharacterized protein LOC117587724 [Drosophila guanche]SPP86093.1 blast:Sterile alpha motif domain-containing protein 15 [Drosophila guanche]
MSLPSPMECLNLCESPQHEREDEEQEFSFRYPSYMFPDVEYNKDDIPLPFKATPDSLFNLCAAVVDAQGRTEVFKWSILDVADWLRDFGYPEYEQTFKENHIDGHKLLSLDAISLVALNIRNFEHIRHLGRGIRALYRKELQTATETKQHSEVYKTFKARTGRSYEGLRETELLGRMHMIRSVFRDVNDWDMMELHMARAPIRRYREVLANSRRYNLYGPSTARREPIIMDDVDATTWFDFGDCY